MICCQQLTKVYRAPAGEVRCLDGLDLEIRPGEFVCVRGPSGCGKTTLLLALGGMLRPTSGRVVLGDQDVYALSRRARADLRGHRIGFVFQMFHLVPYLTLRDNVLLAANSGGTGRDRRTRAGQLLEQLGLGARLGHRPAAVSAGERQRAALARALFHGPKIILADEPTGNLDPENAAEVLRHLRQFQASGGTVVVVTHGTAMSEQADRVFYMRAGKLSEANQTSETK